MWLTDMGWWNYWCVSVCWKVFKLCYWWHNWANVAKDGAILQQARDLAMEILDADPTLSQQQNQLLNRHLQFLYRRQINWSLISWTAVTSCVDEFSWCGNVAEWLYAGLEDMLMEWKFNIFSVKIIRIEKKYCKICCKTYFICNDL